MKKEMIIGLLIVSILLISPIIYAEEQNQSQEQAQLQEPVQTQEQNQSQTYSGVDRLVDNIKLAFSGGDNKVEKALEIRGKEVNSAMNNIQNNNEEDAIKNLKRAKKKLKIVQEKVSLNTSNKVKISVKEITDKINKEENLSDEFDDYLLEEEKTQLTAELTEKTFEYCKELAKEDFILMLREEECNPDTAQDGLKDELKKLKDLQYRMFVKLMLEIRSCIDDPGTCNCEANNDINEKAKCEKMVALAVKCEYKEDETSCDELEAMKPSPGDGFAKSFVPDFLMNLFSEKHKMIKYGINHSNGVPEECWNNNDKPECKKYEKLKENNLDWDEYGNYKPILYPGKHPSSGGIEEPIPTLQESVPECFDEDGMFLEEKCGKISVVWNKEGLVNYIVEKQVDDIINDFENKSRQYVPGTYANGTIDINETQPTMEIREGWMMENNEWVIDPGYQEMKQEMNQIQNQIKNITYALGTEPGGFGGVVVDDDGNVVTDDDGNVVVTKDMSVDNGLIDNDNGGGDGDVDDDDNELPGPQGIVGNQGYGDDEGHQGDVPDDTSGASGEVDED